MFREGRAAAACLLLSATLGAGAGGADGGSGGTPAAPAPSLKATAGQALFFDASLSGSGQQSCGTCHVSARAFTADPATDHGLPVPLGGGTWTCRDLATRPRSCTRH